MLCALHPSKWDSCCSSIVSVPFQGCLRFYIENLYIFRAVKRNVLCAAPCALRFFDAELTAVSSKNMLIPVTIYTLCAHVDFFDEACGTSSVG